MPRDFVRQAVLSFGHSCLGYGPLLECRCQFYFHCINFVFPCALDLLQVFNSMLCQARTALRLQRCVNGGLQLHLHRVFRF